MSVDNWRHFLIALFLSSRKGCLHKSTVFFSSGINSFASAYFGLKSNTNSELLPPINTILRQPMYFLILLTEKYASW